MLYNGTEAPPGQVAAAYQSFMICIEMFFVSLLHLRAFSWGPFVVDSSRTADTARIFARVSSSLKSVRVPISACIHLAPVLLLPPPPRSLSRFPLALCYGTFVFSHFPLLTPVPLFPLLSPLLPIAQTLNPQDIVDDTIRNFSARYNDYHQVCV